MTVGGPGTPPVYIHTLGCPKNDADSGRLARRLLAAGAIVTEDPGSAGTILVNTCGFIEEASAESVQALLDLTAAQPEREVFAFGCLVERYRAELERELPEVAGWFGLGQTEELIERVTAGQRLSDAATVDAEPTARSLPRGSHVGYAYVKVSDGCDQRCSFCAIPAIKGRYRALPPADIEEQADAALRAGAGELVLVGQDTAIWKWGERDLSSLIDGLAQDPRVSRLRLLYLQPEHVDDRLLELLAEHPKLSRYLDIPLQHVSGPILQSMGRRGDADTYRALIHRARDLMPEVSLRSTFIVGYPGESREDFELLLEFVEEVRFDHAGVFPYSPEEGTRAAALPGRPPAEEVAERLGRLSGALNDSAEEAAAARVGAEAEVILDAVGPYLQEDDHRQGGLVDSAPADLQETVAVGRAESQAPEVDGVVFLVGELPEGAAPGTLLPVRITESFGVDLVAGWHGP